MLTQHAIETTLLPLVPEQLHAQVRDLAAIVAALEAGTLTPAEAEQRLNEPGMAPLYAALAGRRVQTDAVELAFTQTGVVVRHPGGAPLLDMGQGNTVGNIQMGDVAGRDLIKPTITIAPTPPITPEQRSAQQNRRMLIEDTRLRVAEIRRSAQRLIPLDLAARPDVVEAPGVLQRPYDLARRTVGQPDEVLPAGTRLIDLYDSQNGQLLILGAPGAGKTMLLHELAADLLDRAERDPALPVPVVFSLATWRPGQSMVDWLVSELASRYMGRTSVYERLAQQGAILPLLDGLDEVAPPERRVQCVAAINVIGQHLEARTPLVVTCREREYADLPHLRLNRAIVARPLNDTQIAAYLDGPSYAALRTALANDAELRDAACTPLLLGMMAQTYQERGPAFPPNATPTQIRQVILSDYVAFCCAPAADARAFRVPVARLRVFLGWLARGMQSHGNQQEFYLEFLQPTWLRDRRQIKQWSVIANLVGGLVVGLLFELLVGLGVGLFFGLLSAGLFEQLRGGKIELAERLLWSFRRLQQYWWTEVKGFLILGLVLGLGIALSNGLVFGPDFGLGTGLGASLGLGLLSVLAFGLSTGLDIGLLFGLTSGVMDVRTKPNQGIHRSAQNALIGGLVVGLGGGLVGGLVGGLIGGLFFGLAGTLVGTLGRYGGFAVIQHYALRLLLALSGAVPLRLVRALDEARNRGLLVRVGGGYRFYHRLLQDYFAAQQEPGQRYVAVVEEERGDDEARR
ncbi:MAG: NACHT domain-containing protein [Chloroflexales bacterium]|nr:NACHT domain-containing protein [Chloroflexales bacterium]